MTHGTLTRMIYALLVRIEYSSRSLIYVAPSEESRPPHSSGSDVSMEGETLAGSVELSRTHLCKKMVSKIWTYH